MTDLLRIQEPVAAPAPPPRWSAFLELGFRPLYIAGCFWAALSVALWVFMPEALKGRMPGVFWHAHEMLWGFIATIAIGFLFTAGTNWTGVNPLKGPALGAFCLLWIGARAGYLVPGATAFVFAAACELLAFLWAALALARAVYGTHNRRNYGVPLLVLLLGLADALYLWAVWRVDYALLMARFHLGLFSMGLVTLLVARRVIPFFAMRAVPGLNIPMHTRSGHWQLGATALAIGSVLAGWDTAAAALLGIAGFIALAQLLSWKPWSVRRVPLLWILYLGYAALGVGLLIAAAHIGTHVLRPAWPAHVIGLAGFSVLIIGMVTRTALGHLGRPLRADRWIVACYGLVIAAAALRLLALLPGAWTLPATHASAGAWILAFAIYLWRFVPMLIRPRIDQPSPSGGRPMKKIVIKKPARSPASK